MKATKQAEKSINAKQHPILIPEAISAIEDYKKFMRDNHHVKVTNNGAINALIITGWKSTSEVKA